MEEKTIKIELSQLIPEVESVEDRRVKHLEALVRRRKGIRRAHLDDGHRPAGLCLHYDPDLVSPEVVERETQKAASTVVRQYRYKKLQLDGLDCSDCALVIEHRIGRMDGVLEAKVDYSAQVLEVEYDAQKTSQRMIHKRISQLGYEVIEGGFRAWYSENRELLFSLLAGVSLLAGFLGSLLLQFPFEVSLAFYLVAYVLGGYDISRHALHSLREKHFDTDLLMVLAALGAAALGEFGEGALLLFLFSLGHALEERALARARRAVSALAELAPKTALVRRDGAEVLVPVDKVALQDVVIVKPGVRIPVDGAVAAGRSSVDQSPVTGESIPVEKLPGEAVYAGSVNGEGVLDVRATRLAQDSTLARVMKMVEKAQGEKSPAQQSVEKFMRVFVPAILAVDLLLIILPPLFGMPFADSFLRAMTLLVAASPCALALSAPSAVLSGVAQAARNGVLVKGGVHLENLGRMRAIAFDKTGTLTKGQPEVTEIIALEGYSEQDILQMAAAVEAQSGHPLARAIMKEVKDREAVVPAATDAEAITGRGIQGTVNGQVIRVGTVKLLEAAGLLVSAETRQRISQLEEQGKTVLLVGANQALVGLVAVSDVLREHVRAVLDEVRGLGVEETVMLSGDNERVAASIARQAGLGAFRANLMPEDKLRAVEELVRDYRIVGMVGDGVNDAPALANASVGIAMGGAGTDVALETADVALMANDLTKLPVAIGLGRMTWRVMRQNLILALVVIILLSGSAILGLASIGAAVLIHEGSTLLVVLNSLRLLRYKLA